MRLIKSFLLSHENMYEHPWHKEIRRLVLHEKGYQQINRPILDFIFLDVGSRSRSMLTAFYPQQSDAFIQFLLTRGNKIRRKYAENS